MRLYGRDAKTETTSTTLSRAVCAIMREDYNLGLELLNVVARDVDLLETHGRYTGLCLACKALRDRCGCGRERT